MEAFIKFYVLVSLWFWAGMLLSAPLRKAFGEMHWRLLERVYDATLGQIEKAIKKVIYWFSQKFTEAKRYMEGRTYELRVKVARSLVNKELLEELTQKNFIAAISRARQMDQGDSGICYEELEKLGHLIAGKSVNEEKTESAVKTAFKLSDTVLLQDIITNMPRAQERILLAFEQAEGNAPYDSIKNEEFRKFIRE
ncbi:MAG TPA: hypothetical protein PKC55_14150 [Dysgonomonas sp.]|uniref:hypothetical protein n=1 Tax=unclassified Dysgonomonas TaxID=2630389 RepID=UPI0025B7C0A0|nr:MULTISPECIES: hypothetical protein [unclassified Dysgonomonas]HML65970.1 hypothetical protein [Dysgonomonas sp.]